MIRRTCIRCGAPFETNNSRKAFCSLHCQERRYTTVPFAEFKCELASCDNKITRRINAKRPKFCCHNHAIKHHNDARSTNVIEFRMCDNCGEDFPISRYDARFCSRACSQEYANEKKRSLHRPIRRICEWCQSPFVTTNKQRFHCRRQCVFNKHNAHIREFARAAIKSGYVSPPAVTKRNNEREYIAEIRAIGKAVKELTKNDNA